MGTSINYRLVKCPNAMMEKLNSMADQHTSGPGWGNGYVTIGPEHSLFGVNYRVLSNINTLMGRCANVPEITAGRPDMFGCIKNTWTFGFDTISRVGKDVTHNTFEKVSNDVTLLKCALVAYVDLKKWATKYIVANILPMNGEDIWELFISLSGVVVTSATDIDNIQDPNGTEPSTSRMLLLILLLRNGIVNDHDPELGDMWRYILGKLRRFKDSSVSESVSVRDFNRVIEYSLEKFLRITRNPLMENCDD